MEDDKICLVNGVVGVKVDDVKEEENYGEEVFEEDWKSMKVRKDWYVEIGVLLE